MSEALNFLVHESSFYPDFFLVLHVSINTKYLPMETYWDISSLWSLDFKLLMQKRIFQNRLENEIIVLDKSMPGIKPWCKYSNTKKKKSFNIRFLKCTPTADGLFWDTTCLDTSEKATVKKRSEDLPSVQLCEGCRCLGHAIQAWVGSIPFSMMYHVKWQLHPKWWGMFFFTFIRERWWRDSLEVRWEIRLSPYKWTYM